MTRLLRFALLGDPVSGSRSPVIHAEALRIAGLEGVYSTITTDEAGLVAAVDQLRTGEFDGLNVTMPLKETAASLSARTGSVNTLRCRDSNIEGTSTDTTAIATILDKDDFAMIGTVLVLGSGGSALSALAAMSDRHVYVSGRNDERVSAITHDHAFTTAIPWGVPVVGAIVINCTPLGMAGEALPETIVEYSSALIDLPYGPSTTPAVTAAREARIPLVDGYEFLAIQAVASFEWWTGIAVDFAPLAEIARNV